MGAAIPLSDHTIIREDMDFVLTHCGNEFKKLAGAKILITGASGFVGSYLVESLLAWNRHFPEQAIRAVLTTRSLAATRKKWPGLFDHSTVTWIEWDGEVATLPDVACTYIIHAAAPTDPAQIAVAPAQAMHSIFAMSEALLALGRKQNIHSMLYLSSGAVYGRQPADLPAIPESYQGAPNIDNQNSCYGEAKRASELLCVLSGLPVVRARLFAFIGPYQDLGGSFAVPDFIRQALARQEITLQSDGSALRTFCYAADLTVCLWKLLLQGRGGDVYNVGGEEVVSIIEVANFIAECVAGKTIVAASLTQLDQSRQRYVPDITRLKSIYTPQIGWRQALRRTLAAHGASGRTMETICA